MTKEHPITPPLELVQQWLGDYFGCVVNGELSDLEKYLATQAARWGADQELETCCKLLELSDSNAREFLYSARRPKPLSLKEQALGLLNEGPVSDLLDNEVAVIRRALESLPD